MRKTMVTVMVVAMLVASATAALARPQRGPDTGGESRGDGSTRGYDEFGSGIGAPDTQWDGRGSIGGDHRRGNALQIGHRNVPL